MESCFRLLRCIASGPSHTLATLIPTISSLAPTIAEVSLHQLRRNVQQLQARAQGAALLGVVKADAYGHGASQVAPALIKTGISHLAVATLPEALEIAALGLPASILIFGAPLPAHLPVYAKHGFEVAITSPAVAEAVADTARTAGPLRVHVKVDTGMTRLGLHPSEVAVTLKRLSAAPGITLAGLWTHFATADALTDTFTQEQWSRFLPIWEQYGDAFDYVHVANSGALLQHPEVFAAIPPARTLVRTGITMYGLSATPSLLDGTALEPVMRVTSRVTHRQTITPGTTVSYGRTWTATRPTLLATVGAGYADGYHRLLSNRAEVGIRGHRYPVAGTICMDMFMVDLGPPGGAGEAVCVGDEVVLFGPGGPSAVEVAAWAETIPYEMVCAVSQRVPRVYI